MKLITLLFSFFLSLGAVQAQEANMRGKNVNITDGDAVPSTSDDTDFGRQLTTSGTVTKTFTIQNTGGSNLTVGAITIGGTHSADFTIGVSPSATVTPGSSTTLTIIFNPSAAGLRSATFSIVTNDADENPYNFSIQGTGFASNLVRWVNNLGAARPATVIVDGITYNTAATTYTDIASAITAAATDDIVYITNGVYRNTSETTSTDCDFFGQLQDASLYIVVNKTITITSETGNYCTSSARLVGFSFNIHTANDITIQGLTMDSVRLNAFWNSNCCAFPPSKNVKIKNNKILNTRGHGIKTDSPGDGTTQIDRGAWEITGNFFLNIGFYNGYGRCTSPMSVSAVWLADAGSNFDISNNVIVNTKWAGILCDGYGSQFGTTPQEGVVNITGNRVHNTIDAGIQIGMNSSPGVFYYPTNAIIANNTITNANTTSKTGIGGITILQSVCRAITINNNDVSNSFNALTICIAGWANSSGAIRMINNNNFYNLSGGIGVKHIAGISPNGLFGTADNLANYNFENNYWGASSGPTYSTNPGGTGVSLEKETTLRGTSPPGGLVYSTSDFDFSPFATSPNTVTSVAIPCDGAADYFRSKNISSTWGTVTDWESSYNNVNFKNASIIPTSAATNVVVQNGHTVTLSGSDASVGDLTINGTGLINLNGRLLSLKGVVTGTGTINATTGTAEFRGSAAQAIPAALFTSNTVQHLTIHNTAAVTPTTTLQGTLNVTGVLTPSLGTFATGNFLTLKSSSVTNTAQVGVVGGTISGNVTVERFIPAKRAFRLLSPGVTTTTNIRANWQEGTNNPNTSTNNNPMSGFGTHIAGGSNANGFDATVNNNPSLFTFNNATQAWVAAANTNVATLSATTPYRILVRGDRSIDLNLANPAASNTVLRATGSLTTGTVNFSGLAANNNEYSFVANPYWAAVDWTAVTRTNLFATYWIWDPAIAGTNGRGAYTSFTRTGAGTGTSSGGGTINKNIQPGQAFFVQNSAAAPALSFAEANKDVGTILTSTFRTNNSSGTEGLFTMKLYLKNNFTTKAVADAATIAFGKDFSVGQDEYDAIKLINPDENLSIRNGWINYGMESRPLPMQTDTVMLHMSNMLSKNYILEIEGKDFANNSTLESYLIDKHLNTKTLLDNKGSIQVNYDIDSTAASAASNRFYLVFNNKKVVLPISNNSLEVKLTPNPATEYVQVNYSAKEKGNTTIRVIGTNGQTITTVNMGEQENGQYQLPINKLASGIYTVEVIVGKEKQTAKLVKQ